MNKENVLLFSCYGKRGEGKSFIEYLKLKDKEIERLNNIINKALEKSKGLQYRFGYVLDDLIYLLMQGSESNE